MKLALIFNPASAHFRAAKLLPEIKSTFARSGVELDVFQTAFPGHGTELTLQLDLTKYDGVVAGGGDGTLFEVINGYYRNPAQREIPLGILPIGTGNAVARDLDLDATRWHEAVEIICANRRRRMDVGRCRTKENEFYYLNILGLGFVADVVAIANKLKSLGNVSYTIGVLWRTIFLKSNRLSIELDGALLERDTIFVEISNTRWTSNFLMAPNAKIDDGLLDVTILRTLSRTRLLQCFPKIFTGAHITMPEVEQIKARHIKIVSDSPKILTPDGELFGTTPIEVECLPGAIEVFWK
ncbi:MAG: diacylglycerol kinase family protein [bacterium]